MKSGKIKLIWSLSITAALLVILLQGYWLYNQYRFTLEKKANETTGQILLAWDDYKTWQKAKLKSQRENLQSYNTNLNQNTSTIYVSEMKENITDWTISIHTIKATGEPVTQLSEDSINKPEEDEQRKNLLNQIEENLFLTQTTNTVQKDSVKGWEEKVLQTDSTLVNTFRFRTSENQNLVYDAVDLFLVDINSPFKISDVDSIVQLKTENLASRIDTLSLPPDSVLWQPKTMKQLSIANPSVTVEIPYNVLKRKVAIITVPVAPAHIIKAMTVQIIISIILVLVLIVCLLLQVQTITRQQRINKLRQNFVNTTIHELKRPVQTLKTIVSYLQQSSPEESEMLNNARIETDNFTSYLQKLRDVNQAETIAGSLHLSYFDFTVVLTGCIENVQKNAGKQFHIETDFPGTPLPVTADKMIMNNIVINLLENAIKYSGEEPVIRVNAGIDDNGLSFSISDNGIGIPASEQSHIFEPFFRSKNDYVASLPGMGLGLSYVKMAVEAHRGTVDVLSKPNYGTTITVKIPRQ
ncbi:Signal transduction histidine kinase [Proteiniphilum saccharofermentans]|uniref:histidine kinase n=1 Tax=Proteiniphilum saccharofermentans TaxID=1642647 RepID=A0A1R3SUT7_9BACT|nr:HAMP domain-containing sensor histidine kinase [Proteiniphilum saccharofermentans]SCD20076.1 Signal transduction histidine kinase [Proteiniphilum saccharofermentans]